MTKNKYVRTGAFALVALIGGSLGAAACSEAQDDRGIGDAPMDQQPDQEIRVWPNGNGFPNVALICAGNNGVYTNTRTGGDMEVVVDDPNCSGGGG